MQLKMDDYTAVRARIVRQLAVTVVMNDVYSVLACHAPIVPKIILVLVARFNPASTRIKLVVESTQRTKTKCSQLISLSTLRLLSTGILSETNQPAERVNTQFEQYA